MNTQYHSSAFDFFLGILSLVFLYGWFMNLVELFRAGIDPITGIALLRIGGVFIPPLGILLGFL